MALETADLRRMLDDAFDDSVASAITLREQLRAKERAAGLLVSTGSLASVSKNSASQSWAYGSGAITPADLARGWRRLIDCFDSAAAALASTDDAAIKAEMLLRLQPVNEYVNDYTLLGAR